MPDDYLIDIPCPGCDFDNSVDARDVEKSKGFICKGCGQIVNVDGSALKQALDGAEDAIFELIEKSFNP